MYLSNYCSMLNIVIMSWNAMLMFNDCTAKPQIKSFVHQPSLSVSFVRSMPTSTTNAPNLAQFAQQKWIVYNYHNSQIRINHITASHQLCRAGHHQKQTHES